MLIQALSRQLESPFIFQPSVIPTERQKESRKRPGKEKMALKKERGKGDRKETKDR